VAKKPVCLALLTESKTNSTCLSLGIPIQLACGVCSPKWISQPIPGNESITNVNFLIVINVNNIEMTSGCLVTVNPIPN
jgi:hypothetical protein